jgi:ribonuclease HI
MRLRVFTDGGARGNPGPAGTGVVVKDSLDNTVYEYNEFIGVSTNNEAEYTAFLTALRWLHEQNQVNDVDGADFFLDSKLVVEQINKRWKIKEQRLLDLAKNCWQLISTLPYQVTIKHVGRSENTEADLLVNQALDEQKAGA